MAYHYQKQPLISPPNKYVRFYLSMNYSSINLTKKRQLILNQLSFTVFYFTTIQHQQVLSLLHPTPD